MQQEEEASDGIQDKVVKSIDKYGIELYGAAEGAMSEDELSDAVNKFPRMADTRLGIVVSRIARLLPRALIKYFVTKYTLATYYRLQQESRNGFGLDSKWFPDRPDHVNTAKHTVNFTTDFIRQQETEEQIKKVIKMHRSYPITDEDFNRINLDSYFIPKEALRKLFVSREAEKAQGKGCTKAAPPPNTPNGW